MTGDPWCSVHGQSPCRCNKFGYRDWTEVNVYQREKNHLRELWIAAASPWAPMRPLRVGWSDEGFVDAMEYLLTGIDSDAEPLDAPPQSGAP